MRNLVRYNVSIQQGNIHAVNIGNGFVSIRNTLTQENEVVREGYSGETIEKYIKKDKEIEKERKIAKRMGYLCAAKGYCQRKIAVKNGKNIYSDFFCKGKGITKKKIEEMEKEKLSEV